jgi:very-short-patch-repair endonuclease
MPARRIVQGQHITEPKYLRVKSLRRTMTPAERTLWAALCSNQIHGLHFRRQQVIDGFIADFYCHTVGLIVEVDGPIQNDQLDYDAERDQVLAARGLRILGFTNDDILQSFPTVLACIKEMINTLSTGEQSPL